MTWYGDAPIVDYNDDLRSSIRTLVSQFGGVDDIKRERRICLAFLADCTRWILANVDSRARLDAELEGCISIWTEVVSAACLRNCLAILQPGHWKIREKLLKQCDAKKKTIDSYQIKR